MGEKKLFRDLHFSDAFMFAAAMEDAEICRGVLECVLGIPIRAVRVRAEDSLLVNPDYRGVRLDVYADDEAGSVFDVEMQTTDKRELPKRSRLYQSQMDGKALDPGEKFNRLPRSYVIFICTYDPFGHRKYRYTCDTRCRETGEEIGDEVYKVFLNTKGENPEEVPRELIDFLNYVEGEPRASENAEDDLVSRIQSRVADIKKSREMEVQYMLFGEMLSDERREGRAEGHIEVITLTARMVQGGDADKIPLLQSDPEVWKAMCEKYQIEV